MIDINSLTIGEIKEIASLISCNKNIDNSHPALGKFVIARTHSAGVHFGVLKSVNNQNLTLENSRRLWRWDGAFTLSEVSQEGISEGQISCLTPLMYLTNAIEIIPCSKKVEKQLSEFEVYKP